MDEFDFVRGMLLVTCAANVLLMVGLIWRQQIPFWRLSSALMALIVLLGFYAVVAVRHFGIYEVDVVFINRYSLIGQSVAMIVIFANLLVEVLYNERQGS